MRVVLFTVDEPLYLPRYIEPLLEAHRDDIVEIVDAPAPNGGLSTLVKERYRMFGPSAFVRYGSRFVLRKLVGMAPHYVDAAVPGSYRSVRNLAASYDVPFQRVHDVGHESFVSHVRGLEPTLLLSISCRQKLGPELLSIEGCECVNIHGSLLPAYRGRATAFWVLYNDESESGVTAHRMTEEFDGGRIIEQRRFPIKPRDSMDDVYERVVDIGGQLAVDIVEASRDGLPEGRPNDTEESEYYPLPDAEQRREFLDRGNRFL